MARASRRAGAAWGAGAVRRSGAARARVGAALTGALAADLDAPARRARAGRGGPGSTAARRAPGRDGPYRPGCAGAARPLALHGRDRRVRRRDRRTGDPACRREADRVGRDGVLPERPDRAGGLRRQRVPAASVHLQPCFAEAVPRRGKSGRSRRSGHRPVGRAADGGERVRARGGDRPARGLHRDRRRERGRRSRCRRGGAQGRGAAGLRGRGRDCQWWTGAGRFVRGAGAVPSRSHRSHRRVAVGGCRSAARGRRERRGVRPLGPAGGDAGARRATRAGEGADARCAEVRRAGGPVSVAAGGRGDAAALGGDQCHPERSEGGEGRVPAPSLRSG